MQLSPARLARHLPALAVMLLGMAALNCRVSLPEPITRQTVGPLKVYLAEVSLHHRAGSPGDELNAGALQKFREAMSEALKSAGYLVSPAEAGSDLVLNLKGEGGLYVFGIAGVVEATLQAQRGGTEIATAQFLSQDSCGDACPLPRTASALVNKLTAALAAKPAAPVPVASPSPEPTQPAPNTAVPLKATSKQAVSQGVVAVLPVDTSQSQIEPAAKMAFEENIRTIAGDTLSPLGYTVLTGETTLALLSDNNVQSEKICDATCTLGAAREMKAKLFVSGVLAKTEGEFVAFIRLFESTSGRQLASVRLEGDTVRALRKAFETKAPDFFAKANGQ